MVWTAYRLSLSSPKVCGKKQCALDLIGLVATNGQSRLLVVKMENTFSVRCCGNVNRKCKGEGKGKGKGKGERTRARVGARVRARARQCIKGVAGSTHMNVCTPCRPFPFMTQNWSDAN